VELVKQIASDGLVKGRWDIHKEAEASRNRLMVPTLAKDAYGS